MNFRSKPIADRKRGRLSVKAVSEHFTWWCFDRKACLELLLGLLHDKALCPRCGEALHPAAEKRFWSGGQFYCRACHGKHFGTSGTILSGCPLDPRQIIMLCLMLSRGCNAVEACRAVGLSRPTVMKWRRLLNSNDEGKLL